MNKRYTILFNLLCFFISSVAFSQCTSNSNVYTFNYAGKKYEIVKDLKNWTDAAACAVERGGYLAEINDKNEQDTILKALLYGANISTTYTQVNDGGGTAYVWIGATDKTTEGKWMWDGKNSGSGTNFWNGQGAAGTGGGSAVSGKYINWGGSSTGTPNEPDDYGALQDAAAIALDGWPSGTTMLGKQGEWNDLSMSNLMYFVIEYDKPNGLNMIQEKNNALVLYPNPVTNSLHIQTKIISEKPIQISVFDLFGKELIKFITSTQNNNLLVKDIDTSELQNGTYFVTVSSNGNIKQSKFNIIR